MRRSWPFLVYAAVVLVHLVLIALESPARTYSKWALMPVLLFAVLGALLPSSGASGERAADDPVRSSRRSSLAVMLLALGIVFSWAGDVLLGPTFVVGLASFALAHVVFIALFLGPAKARRIPWWVFVYLIWYAVLIPILWPRLGELALVVAVYGLVLAGTAATAVGVNALAAWGGLLFLASDSLLAFRLFWPDFGAAFPDPWQDLAIMALYCAGEGLIAMGVVRRLAADRRTASPPPLAPGAAR